MVNLNILADYSNLSEQAKNPKVMIISAVESLAYEAVSINVTLRMYGGWFNGVVPTTDRYTASAYYQASCPSVLKVNGTYVRIRFEFADELAVLDSKPSGIPLTHTLGLKGRPGTYGSRATGVQCQVAGCELSKIRKWFKKQSGCAHSSCPHSFDVFSVRREQKQVDTHLAVDALSMAMRLPAEDSIVIVSDDLDIIPAVLASVLASPGRRILCLRSPGRNAMYLDADLMGLGVKLGEVKESV